MVRVWTTAWLASLGAALPAASEDASHSASATLERHFTTNALDGPLALRDWYSVLRGTATNAWQGESTSLRVTLDAEVTRFDRYNFEDDATLAMSAVATRRTGPLELRGTLTAKLASEGDDLIIGGLVLPLRTETAIAGGGVEAGIDLGGGFALAVSASASREHAGASVLIDGTSLELEPDTTRFAGAASLGWTTGSTTGAVVASLKASHGTFSSIDADLSSREAALGAELRRTFTGGSEISTAVGAAWLQADGLSPIPPRLTYALTSRVPLGQCELRASLKGTYDHVDSDDPIAAFVQRGQVEMAWRLAESLVVGGGLFVETRDNVALGFDERSWGVYGEAGWTVSPRMALLWRVEYDRASFAAVDVEEQTLDAFLRIRTSL